MYRGWRLCHGHKWPSCYDVAASVLKDGEQFDVGVDVAALQQCLEECWSLLQVYAPTYLRGGHVSGFGVYRESDR